MAADFGPPGPCHPVGERREMTTVLAAPSDPGSCSTGTAGPCSCPAEPGPRTLASRPRSAGPTRGFAGLNVVRPRAGALQALHVDLAAAPALTSTQPGKPCQEATAPAGRGGAKTSRACEGSTEADPSRIK